MAKANLKLPVKDVKSSNLSTDGTTAALYIKGTELYGSIRRGGVVELEFDDGKVVKASVNDLKVGSLVELVGSHGHMSVYTYGQPYTPLNLIQSIGDVQGVEVVDTTELYLLVVFVVGQFE